MQGKGNGGAVRQQAHHIIQSHHLQQGIHQFPLSTGLADGHHGGGRGGGAGEGSQHHTEGQVQPQQEPGDPEYHQRSGTGFGDGDPDHLPAVFAQGFELEELPGVEGDEAESQVRQEVGLFDHGLGDQVQAAGPDENAGGEVGSDAGQTQPFGDAGHAEGAEEHNGKGYDNQGGGREIRQSEIQGIEHGKLPPSEKRWDAFAESGWKNICFMIYWDLDKSKL